MQNGLSLTALEVDCKNTPKTNPKNAKISSKIMNQQLTKIKPIPAPTLFNIADFLAKLANIANIALFLKKLLTFVKTVS